MVYSFPIMFWIFKNAKQNLISTVCETDSTYNLQGVQRQVTDGYARELRGEGGTHVESGRMVSFTQADERTRFSDSPASVLAGGHTLSTKACGWEQECAAQTGSSLTSLGLSFPIHKVRIIMPTSVQLLQGWNVILSIKGSAKQSTRVVIITNGN